MKKYLNLVIAAGLMAVVVHLFGNLIYMNLRSADPILPGWEEYDDVKFNARADRGEPALVEIYASWCPTCKAQHEAFERLIEEGRQPPIRAVRVDFDRDEAFRLKYGLTYTGILMIFDGDREIARQSGLTSPDAIAQFLALHGYAPDQSSASR